MTVVLNQSQRGPGLLDSGNIAVPGAQPQTNYIFTALMAAADIADPTLTITFQMFLDNSLVRDIQWTGGIVGKNGAFREPSFSYSTADIVPSTARVTVSLPKKISFGLDLTTDLIVR
jgi:hypothetical protein